MTVSNPTLGPPRAPRPWSPTRSASRPTRRSTARRTSTTPSPTTTATQPKGVLTVTVGSDITKPTAIAPVAALGAGRVNESAPVRINWSATDAGTGVKTYQVQVSIAGGAFKNVYTGPARSSRRRSRSGGPSCSACGRPTRPATAPAGSPRATRKPAVYQDSNGAVHKTGPWTKVKNTAASRQGLRVHDQEGQVGRPPVHGPLGRVRRPQVVGLGLREGLGRRHLVGRFNLHHGSLQQGRIIARRELVRESGPTPS